jgi:hypothetical protein
MALFDIEYPDAHIGYHNLRTARFKMKRFDGSRWEGVR